MSTVTDAIHAHHLELARILSTHLAALEENRADADPAGLATFLKSDLLPHALGEEASLYPTIAPIVAAHGNPTATMSIDHEHIARYIREIDETAASLAAAPVAEQAALRAQLTRLTIQLDAIMRLHTEKEERVYIDLFSRYLTAAEQQAVLDAMHEGGHADEAEPVAKILDVRPLPPAQRHALIFKQFDDLASGDAFTLVNDHDPKPLYYQLSFERKGQLTWDYIEQGPETWQVRIGKTVPVAAGSASEG